jgi:hypothetical protein
MHCKPSVAHEAQCVPRLAYTDGIGTNAQVTRERPELANIFTHYNHWRQLRTTCSK